MGRTTADLTDEELAQDWTLSRRDLVEIRRSRGADNRLGFALQLCAVRQRGRFLTPKACQEVPLRVINHLAFQLGSSPLLLIVLPSRRSTRVDQEKRVREYLGLATFDDRQASLLKTWLRKQAAQNMLVDELTHAAEQHLRGRNVILPARSTLERLAARVATRTQTSLIATINSRLSPALRDAFDVLLRTTNRRSRLFALKQFPPEPNPTNIQLYLDYAEELRAIGADQIDLAGVRPETIQHNADLARRYDAGELKRFGDFKRHALIACFLVESNKSVLDHLVEMHHVFLTGLQRRARNAHRKKLQELQQNSGRNLELVLDTLDAFLQPGCTRAEVESDFDLDVVRGAAHACRELQNATDVGEIVALRARHHTLKRYFRDFLRLPFEGEPGTEALLEATEYARRLHDQGLTNIDEDTPTDFATGIWKRGIEHKMDIRSWELALAFALRTALRSGDLYLPHSRHHVSFWNLTQSPMKWANSRDDAYLEMKLPVEPSLALTRLRGELDDALGTFRNGINENPFATIDDGQLLLSKRDALEIPDSVQDLRSAIEAHLPRIRIEDLLLEVDRRTNFTDALMPPDGQLQRGAGNYPVLLAAVVAHGTNLGTMTMAQSTRGISVDMLQHVSRWCLQTDALKSANRALVDYHHTLPFARVWGDGTRSSSDGQRFRVQASSLLAGFYPRYFGFYDRAITVYTHVSDQHAAFSSRAISCSPREALFVLDGLLHNDTLLRPREHYTDTHGFTEQLFGLCYLLGFSFMPRLKDLKDQQLYMLDPEHVTGELRSIFRSSINAALVDEQWDQLVRVASSLRERTAPAHVVMDRLAASSPADRLAKALTMLGRIVKTSYILRYLHDADIRDRVHLQLNRGESRHALARRLFFANQGSFRSGDYAEIMNKVSALSVLSNAVLVWNTIHMDQIVDELETSTGTVVDRADLARISPLLSSHVIPSGTYRFAAR